MNNCFSAYGWGAAITQATKFAAMDRLGIAQYLSRVGLLLDANEACSTRQARLAAAPGGRACAVSSKNMFVTKDWFECSSRRTRARRPACIRSIYRANRPARPAGTGRLVGMLTEFINDWYDETTRWVDATVKTAAEESPENAISAE